MPFITRQRRSFWVLLLLSVCALVLACHPGERGPLLRDADMPTLEQQGNGLRAALEQYQRQRASYPATLAEAGVRDSAWATPFGPWRYARAGEGPGVAPECRGPYALSVGDYDRHHFEVCWAWEQRAWAWNR